MDVAQFRAAFPEFAVGTYPDAQVQFYLTLAGKLLSVDAWSDCIDEGVGLWTAHNLAITPHADAVGSLGGNSGVVASKSVDKVSVSYNLADSTVEGGGNFNLSTYGTRYLFLANLIGAQGVGQLNVGPSFYPAGAVVGAWPWGR